MTEPVVRIENLTLALPKGADRPHAVEGLSLDLMPGRILCVVGESGSGKSMSAYALTGLLPRALKVAGGRITFEGRDLLGLDERAWRGLRGRRIAMIFQEPMTALNPVMRIGDQIAEMFEAHGLLTPAERRARAVALAREVGLPDPEQIVRAYPHQLSGGQRQRAMIAMALALEPSVLVADEPTTALDVTTQAQILKLIRELQQRRGMSVLFITHDFGVVADIADHVAVLQRGKLVESGPARAVLENPQAPYTRALLAAVPSLTPPERPPVAANPVALSVAGLGKTYTTRGGLFGKPRVVAAVREVAFDLRRGETLGIVGESGSGKSTTARLAIRLVEPDRGTVRLGTLDFTALGPAALRAERRRIQMIFQDPFASLNPRRTVEQIITAGPIAHGTPARQARARARELLDLVGLQPSAAERYPNAFSGGQRQRIGIARALAMEPDVLVADEAVSALDVSVQAQVLRLLEDLKQRLGIAMLFITHDLRVAATICDRIAVMHRGAIVEEGPTAALFAAPEHPYTRSLLAAAPGSGSVLARPHPIPA
ncbi:ABC transporter ATP-binding protein [Methylobacterium gregans]|uniref:Glutathione import ATP-binding protein GsiA n=1 Tax=Methylobacterium gregans TaxID=374424 RepID=A0AA37MA05_9HYPH|nr:ABC transporter ATP-binding protein [Methylobacterium gregans]MDQ0521082.1 peptide/nickel transport system ATP-binding protein [Methylobacterium gregans]GJD77867.1 Glutathione import ATP-binding protein GsiA [Methylobacterium gregans]GLS54249.1 ABC transporter ATP-binding protein [Methylobacterium gregans]